MPERRFTDEELDSALDALTAPDRFREAETRVARLAPRLQLILARALQEGGWFDQAQDSEVRKAARVSEERERVSQIRTLLAEETRMGMLVGVAVGWELARELEINDDHEGGC